MTDDAQHAAPPAAHQHRSRATESRLLKAAIAMLAEHGLDGATVPRIAAAAEVAPASIYRRFHDRDTLIRAALLDALERSVEGSRNSMRIESFKKLTLEEVASRLAAVTIQQYRSQPRLMRALTRFVETDSDATFRSRALSLVAVSYERLIEALLPFKNEIARSNPRRAITFALLTMATVVEVHALDDVSM